MGSSNISQYHYCTRGCQDEWDRPLLAYDLAACPVGNLFQRCQRTSGLETLSSAHAALDLLPRSFWDQIGCSWDGEALSCSADCLQWDNTLRMQASTQTHNLFNTQISQMQTVAYVGLASA